MIRTEFKSPLLSLRCQLSTVNCQLFTTLLLSAQPSDFTEKTHLCDRSPI
ncbi:MAG: hypothetical protein JGK01_16545 [Microcoleus sp. PH2017_03_ELD_O_A]|nr:MULTISPECIES: hypothetical protein [unclassified Microcoleus]MCC3432715.1 hypothetical protein [Microcoleus sp. PH2017_04_SCI_O_A]MCC3443346.1 hypothetical protein [Microcoleus sp. PH2017_03_ELD_O_A]MCC3513597.1 hypothetical protein [Microcoleus sp. PH2017_17_BER_D_A]MCC3547051.1 hypothetical protein [Microcoleus sp. PH2017_24_DOB_U_A]MCC3566267.1 hypothetical protein [Microcoleus sp. PH2017_31_RDM_U_A]MCC3625474.1 hypothetical protein [Microcoleus sp. PH2017_36_ELK_O_B]